MRTLPALIRPFLIVLLAPSCLLLAGQPSPRQASSGFFPDSIDCAVRPFYRHRTDGAPGRELLIHFKGAPLQGAAECEIQAGGVREVQPLNPRGGRLDSAAILLPEGVGVHNEAPVNVTVHQGTRTVGKLLTVPPMRYWTVYVYPHSHVDIGYSNTHANVEFIHKRNIDQAIAVADSTDQYPAGARYLWNPEVIWPFERYLRSAPPERIERAVQAVRRGQICLDAAYVNLLTSTCNDEELVQALRPGREAEQLTGKTIDTYVQVDIPGMSWGLVSVLAQQGVRYVMMMPNGGRGNAAMVGRMDHRPFWWIGPDGTSRVLFLHAGGYGAGMEKGGKTGRPWFGQRDREKIPEAIRTANPREDFLDHHLFRALPELEAVKYPYDLYVVTWAMWDNALIDADLPHAVKSWNEDYAYPHLVISSAHEIMSTFEKRYGDRLPTVTGDFSEYWNDGLGTAAREARMGRNAADRLVQAETLWPMLHPGKPAPRADFDEAWRCLLLCNEHTFTYENPYEPYFEDAIWKMKQHYFHEADEHSTLLLDEALAPASDKSNGALGPLEGPSRGGIAVFNTLSWRHGGLVSLTPAESRAGDQVVDDQGRAVLSQRLSTGSLVFLASDVPAFGSRHYRVTPGAATRGRSLVTDAVTLENSSLRIVLDRRTGNLVSLRAPASGREFVDASAGGGLNFFRWLPARGAGDARPDTLLSLTTIESGPVVGELRTVSRAPGCRSVVRTVRMVAGLPAVEFTNVVDKLPLLPKDGVHFGFSFALPGPATRIDIPWAVMRVERDQWPAANRAWMSTQHFADVSNASAGVTWCSLDAPLIESGSMTADNTAGWDGKGDVWPARLTPSAVIYSWVMNNHWFTNTPLTQDGPVEFRYRLMPHGPYDQAAAYRFGAEQSQPLVPLATNAPPASPPPVALDNDRVAATLLKATAGGEATIIRLRSLSETAETVHFTWPARLPRLVRICDRAEMPGPREAREAVSVPAQGLLTLYVKW